MADAEYLRSTEAHVIYTGQDRTCIPHYVEHVVVAATVTKIRSDAFHSCEALSSIELPCGLKIIDTNAFSNCSALQKIAVPSTVESVGYGAFDCCLTLESVGLGEGINEIGPRAFMYCLCLARMAIPSSIDKIGFSTFEHCSSLVDATLPEGLLEIQGNAFKGCGSLTKIALPSTLQSLGQGAFMDCVRLGFVALPKGIRKIESYTFASCLALTNMLIPSSVETIENEAFVECKNLISVELFEGLLRIDDRAFHLCSSLLNVALPNNTVIGDGSLVISECEKLQENLPDPMELNDFIVNRFATLPLHKLCYDQGNYSTTLCTNKLAEVIEKDKHSGAVVDAVRMTPFHIIALSTKPNCSLLQELMKLYPIDLFAERDADGRSPMDYFNMNPSPDAACLMGIVLRSTFLKRAEALGLKRWAVDATHRFDSIDFADLQTRAKRIGEMNFKLVTYERLEAISLLEQALWKTTMDETVLQVDIKSIDRQNYRIKCGIDAVIPNVLPFLGKLDAEDHSWSNLLDGN